MAIPLNKGRALDSLSLTPLIDVVFLLLIFFLVATRFAEEEREIDIRLPTASEARPLITKPQELFVNVTREGRYFVGGKYVEFEALEPILAGLWESQPGRAEVIIRGDRQTAWENIVAVANLCARIGLDYTPAIANQRSSNSAQQSE